MIPLLIIVLSATAAATQAHPHDVALYICGVLLGATAVLGLSLAALRRWFAV